MPYKQDEWTNASGELSGNTAYVRRNVSLTDNERASRPYVLVLTLIFDDVDEDGMPSTDEALTAADLMEQRLADQFVADHDALFGMIVTSDGTRDLFLFLGRELSEPEIERAIQAAEPDMDFDFDLEHDPQWQVYYDLAA